MTSSAPVGGIAESSQTGTAISSMQKSSRSLVPEYHWDKAGQRYRDVATGRFVSRAEVNGVLNTIMSEATKQLVDLTRDMIEGRVNFQTFGLEAAIHLKNAHICAAALARGGMDRMTQSDWGRLGNRLKGEFGYLRRWVAQLESGRVATEGQAVLRANMYVLQAWATYESERRRSHVELGTYQFERRVLDSVHPCDDCVAYASEGWMPIGTLPEIGDSECDGNCRCSFEFATEEEVYGES